MPLLTNQYKGQWRSEAGKVTAGLAESNGSLLPGLWLTSPAGCLPSKSEISISQYGTWRTTEVALPYHFTEKVHIFLIRVYPCTNLCTLMKTRNKKTRSTGTMHTSTKARLTNAAIWRISMSSRFMSTNHFPYLPIVTNPENNPWQWHRLPPKFNYLFTGPFCTKLLRDRQTMTITYSPWQR